MSVYVHPLILKAGLHFIKKMYLGYKAVFFIVKIRHIFHNSYSKVSTKLKPLFCNQIIVYKAKVTTL